MRSYPPNSPEAAARIVALVLIADGRVCSAEIDRLRQCGAERELGLAPHLLPYIVHTLCEELLDRGPEPGASMIQIDDSVLASLMSQISDPRLQEKVLRLSWAAAQADGQLADGEAVVLDAARRHWRWRDGQEPVVPASTGPLICPPNCPPNRPRAC